MNWSFPGKFIYIQASRYLRILRIIFVLLLFTTLSVGVIAQQLDASASEVAEALNTNGLVRVIIVAEPQRNAEEEAGNLTATENLLQETERSIAEIESVIANTGSQMLRKGTSIPFISVNITRAGFDRLLRSQIRYSIELDSEESINLDSSRSVIGADLINAEGLRGDGDGGSAIWEVAIIDTGVQSAHTALTSKIAAEACFTSDNSCPNGANTMIGAGAGLPCSNFQAGCFHGTHVAGIAASANANGEPGGIAIDSNIVSVRVFNDNAIAFVSNVIAGLDFVLARVVAGERIAVANMSFGGGFFFDEASCDAANAAYKLAVDMLRDNGILVVASAGNNGFVNAMSRPACISSVISVGNTNDNDAVAQSSNTASFMDLWAPGVDITSTDSTNNSGYVSLTGTSMSAPAVSGAAAALYDCADWNRVGSGGPPLENYDDTVSLAIIDFGLNVPDLRLGGAVTAPRLDLLNSAITWNSNNQFSNAALMNGNNGVSLDYNSCGSIEAGEFLSNSEQTASTWHQWTASQSGELFVTTCSPLTNFDTNLSVYSGVSIDQLNLIASNNDDTTCASNNFQSSLTLPVNSGDTVFVQITGNNVNEQGRYELVWQFNQLGPPEIESPVSGDSLNSSVETFTWADNGELVDEWWLYVGSSIGARDYYDSGNLFAIDEDIVSGLPIDGSSIFTRLWYRQTGGGWSFVDSTYIAAFITLPEFTSPNIAIPLSSPSVSFSWTPNGSVVDEWWVYAGSGLAANDYFNSGNLQGTLNATVTGLPTDGSTIYMRLWYRQAGGTWFSIDSTFTAVSVGSPVITSPSAGSTLNVLTETFFWSSNGSNVDEWWLYVGSSVGATDYHNSGNLLSALDASVSNLPGNGSMVYVRLWHRVTGGNWSFVDTTYTSGTLNLPTIVSPTAGAIINSPQQALSWSPGNNVVDEWWIYAGSLQGANNYHDSGNLFGALSENVGGLPNDGSTVYVRLWFRQNGGVWFFIDTAYISES